MKRCVVFVLLASFFVTATLALAVDTAGNDVSQRARDILAGKNDTGISRTTGAKWADLWNSVPWYKKILCVAVTLLVTIIAGVLGWVIFPLTLAPINLILRSELAILGQRIGGAIAAAGFCGYFTLALMLGAMSTSGKANTPDRAQALIQAAMEEEAELNSK